MCVFLQGPRGLLGPKGPPGISGPPVSKNNFKPHCAAVILAAFFYPFVATGLKKHPVT